MVQEVLTDYGVIILNSPVRYPPYNGVNENLNGQIQIQLDRDPRFQAAPTEHKEAHLDRILAQLNHHERRCLTGNHPCRAFGFRRSRVTFCRRMRREIGDEGQTLQQEILGELERPDDWHRRLALCRAVEVVLLKHGLILVSQHGVPVSPQTIRNLPVGPPPGSTHNHLSTNFAPQKVP